MTPFTRLTGVAAAILIPNLDTDQLLPKQFLKVITRRGLADALFFDARFDGAGRRLDFILNTAPFDRAVIILGAENFGCGSSREHAVWALLDFGVRCVIAPSFGNIFANNCANNGLLTLSLAKAVIGDLAAEAAEGSPLTVDLQTQQVIRCDATAIPFDMEPQRRDKLLKGLDAIGETLLREADITRFEQRAVAR
jgi:3-isopropylmalate/(R)-2-methylmalate dehydratase small subunit